MKRFRWVSVWLVNGMMLMATISVAAGIRDEYRQELLAKQKRIAEVQMMDLGIDSPPEVDRNALGPIGHHTERSAEKEFTLYSYPKYFFGNDGRLQLTNVQIRPSKKVGVSHEMEDAVYRFYACPDGSYWIFHYGMWMYFTINDFAYMDRSTGNLYYLGWKHLTTLPEVQSRMIEWPEIFPGVGLMIELSEDFVKESILLTDEARASLPDPMVFGLQPDNTDIVLVFDFVMDELCKEYLFSDYDLREEYRIADSRSVRALSDSFAIEGELAFSRNGIVRHKFLRDEALLPGYIDCDQTPKLRTEVKKYWQKTQNGKILLAYGIPYSAHQDAWPGTITIDPTIKFQEGIYSYSGSYMTQIRGDTGYTNYNYGRDAMLKVGDSTGGSKWRSLVRFNLSSISGITANNVDSAALRMKFRSYLGTLASRSASAYQIKREWNEGNSAQGETPQTGEATWNQAKYNQISWSTAGCDNTTYDRNASADSSIALTTTLGNWNEWNITNSVKSWLNNGLSNNYGVLIRPNWTNQDPEFAHYSDDDSTGSNRPIIIINVINNYIAPFHNDDFEILGENTPVADGIVFKKNGVITQNWTSGDEISMEWKLRTFKSYRAYGEGQFLRMWIDLDIDGVFEPDEEIKLKSTSGTLTPYVRASNGLYQVCEDEGFLVDTFIAPLYDITKDYIFYYKFTVPNFNGTSITTTRILLRYAGWPPDDPTKDFDKHFDEENCDSEFGDHEDYSVTINP